MSCHAVDVEAKTGCIVAGTRLTNGKISGLLMTVGLQMNNSTTRETHLESRIS